MSLSSAAPTLYSLRHCPYAMRARLGILLAEQQVNLRPIVLTDKPAEMLEHSPKGTVPVLVLSDSAQQTQVIDESLDVMLWALQKTDPRDLLYKDQPQALEEMLELIARNDGEFVQALGAYKAAARYHDDNLAQTRSLCESFVAELEQKLEQHSYLFGERPSLADYALLPFIRRFSKVERKWFNQAAYPKLRAWLTEHYANPIYSKAMRQFPLWLETGQEVVFGRE